MIHAGQRASLSETFDHRHIILYIRSKKGARNGDMLPWRRFRFCWPPRRRRPLLPLVDEVIQVSVSGLARELPVQEPRVPVAVEAGVRVAEAAAPPRAAVPHAQVGQDLLEALRLNSLVPFHIDILDGPQFSPNYSSATQTCLVARDDARTSSRVDFPPSPWFLDLNSRAGLFTLSPSLIALLIAVSSQVPLGWRAALQLPFSPGMKYVLE